MKKITLIIFLLATSLIASKNINAQIREQVFGTIISSEETNLTDFSLYYKIYVNDTVTVNSNNVFGNECKIPVNDIPLGQYYIKLFFETSKKTYIGKFIKI